MSPTPSETDAERIRNLLAAFCQHLDARRFKEWSETFAEDGIFGARRGRAAIYESILAGELALNPQLQRKHAVVNAVINVDGDAATSVSDLVMFDSLADGPWTIRVGRYTDRLRRTGDRWLFSERQLQWIDAGERPLTTSDRLEIQELVAKYCWAIDTHDGQSLADTFTPDGVFDGVRRFEGRDQLVGFGRGDHLPPNRTETAAQHWVTNMVFTGNSTAATVRSYFVRHSIIDGGPVLARVGYYVDELVKDNGRWLFKTRTYRDWASNDAASANGTSAP
jgi:ketosteroid isomerase-like protein